MKVTIITHDNVAHADETFAAAMLRLAHPGHEHTIIRTRNSFLLREQAGAPLTFLLDVGGEYDASRRLFDHHQREGAGYRDAEAREWPYATAGLVWRHYGMQVIKSMHPVLNTDELVEVVQHIDDTLLKFIDAVDCGVRIRSAGPSISGLFASFNPPWYNEGEGNFYLMLELAQVLLTNYINRYVGKILARNKVRASTRLLGGSLLVLDQCVPWSDVVVHEMPEVQLVAFPVDNEKWQIRAAQNSDMSPRIVLPESWAGLEKDALAQVTGVEHATFCHRSRHLAGAETYDGIFRLAELALQEKPVTA